MSPIVSIIMGSTSDLPVMEKAAQLLNDLHVPFEMNALSAHRTPEAVEEFAKGARKRGIKVIIAAAGMAAALPGVIAANTTLPVIGVPIKGSVLDGVDALYSIIQMPPGIPVATVAINGAMNAAILAVQMLALSDTGLAEAFTAYKEGLKKGAFAKKSDGTEYLVDFGEFYCAVVDLTNPEAYQWFKDEVIKKHILDIGIDGWMADFGEYLPTDDIVLHSGKSAMIEHNHWPALWAQCNYDALAETGKLGEVVYFMRAGATGSQKHCTLLWAGDQSVDFTIHDGLATVICAALSAGMIGCGLSHSDIGGYTSLFGNTRTKELFLRWAEMAAFTPVMRTHECNRPNENFQYYDDEDCMKQLARLVDVYTMLAPYIKTLVAENAAKGVPVQRPMFLHYEQDLRCYDIQYQHMLGSDMVVAPVYRSGQAEWPVYLPEGEWVHLWTGVEYGQGDYTVAAPMGDTPVLYRKDSVWAKLFESIREKYGK